MLHVVLGSYNVGGAHPRRERRRWSDRLPRVLEAVDEVGPGVMAFQEIPPRGRASLAAAMSARGYHVASGSRGATRLPQAIYYRPRGLELRGWGAEPLLAGLAEGSRPAARPRLMQWADLLARGGTPLRVCNLHLTGNAFRRAFTSYVFDRSGFRSAFLLGDFNAVPDEHVHRRLMDGGWVDSADAPIHRDAGATIHRFGRARSRRIDWILAPPGWVTLGYQVRRRADPHDEPSDHHPVFAHVAKDIEQPRVEDRLRTLLERAAGVHRPWRHVPFGLGADTLK